MLEPVNLILLVGYHGEPKVNLLSVNILSSAQVRPSDSPAVATAVPCKIKLQARKALRGMAPFCKDDTHNTRSTSEKYPK